MLVFYPTEWRENEHTLAQAQKFSVVRTIVALPARRVKGTVSPSEGAELPRDLWARRDLQARLFDDSRDRIR